MRIFWVGWGLMQHHDWEFGGWLLLLCGLVSGGLGRKCYQVSWKRRRGY